ncbi:hypothetical protein HY256_12000, partial [Candidatus Sumerlaeota bacterium]|nr:hypothetical protein [Candidatus Sumerlaeota bacterium]
MDKVFEFWLGRAGSGKTTACIQSIAALANDQPRGTPLLLLVPEQASAQAEYELATQSGLTGYTRARVITFDWLRREVFKQAGGRPKRVLDEQSRVLLLRRLIRQRKEALRVLGDCADLLGLAEAVSQSLTELHRYGWKEEDLEARLAQLKAERAEGGREARETLLEMKLRDLALLWRDYNQSLARREMGDDALLTAMALERIRPWKELDGAQVWIDGFASFTALERALLEALLDHAEGARLALCLDPAEMRSHSAAKFPLIGAERIFGNVEETFRIIRERVSELGWRVKEVELPLPKQATRFSGCPPLAHLETQLTRLRTEAFDAKRWDETRREYSEFPGSPIELVEAQDRRGEVEAAARRIAAMCADGGKTQPGALHGMRWSDATLVTRDLAAYSPFVREIFPQYGIPFFIDERRGIAAHPLARLLASALRIVTQGWRTDSVMAYLKSGLGPIDDRDMIARIESHAAARKLNGGDWLTAAHWSDRDAGRPDGGDTLYAVWEKASGPLRALQDSLARGGSDGPRSLWDFLSSLEAAQKLERWIEEARREGNEETALIHTEAWKEVVDLLDRIHLIAEPGCAADSRAEAAELLEI